MKTIFVMILMSLSTSYAGVAAPQLKCLPIEGRTDVACFDASEATRLKVVLQLAIEKGDLVSTMDAIAKGADVNQGIMLALDKKNNEILAQLLSQPDVDLSYFDADRTPILQPSKDKELQTSGMTFLTNAILKGNADAVRLLLKAGVDVNPQIKVSFKKKYPVRRWDYRLVERTVSYMDFAKYIGNKDVIEALKN